MNYRRAIDAVQLRLWPRTAAAEIEPITGWDLRAVLVGLMVPMGMTVLNLTMFGVALPAIRDSFGIEADTVAWLVTAYTLPFVLFMPLYGRLGDGLGKRRLFSVGILIFFCGNRPLSDGGFFGAVAAGARAAGRGHGGRQSALHRRDCRIVS